MFTDPDGDLYLEDLGGPDITAWRNYEPHGPTPFGINAHEIYPFRNLPGDAARNQLMIEGERHAAAERIHLGLPHPPPGGSAAVAPVAAAAAPANPGGGAVGGAALVAPLAGAAAVGARPNIAGGGGAAALAAALNQPPGGAQAMNSGLNGDDARTLPVTRDVDGNRFKEFRVGVQECKQSKFSDWPIGGPRTVRHVLMEMVNHGGSALAHHQAWRVACKFQPSDGPAVEHEGLCKILQTMLTYDQLEEKHKFKLQASDESGEGALFMGAMGGARVGSVVSPKLTEWVGGELQKEALVAKERRKVSNCPVALDNCLPPADREWLGDLTNAVYTLAVPDGIAEMFTMPGIEAGKVGVSDIAGTPTDPETIVLPYVTVLPMGGVGLFTFVSCEPSVAEVVDRHVSRHLLRQAKTKLRGSIPEGLTYLEARSVREPTRLDYMRRIKDFNHWLGPHVVDFTNPLDVDNILVEYLQDLFDSGFKVDSGIRIHVKVLEADGYKAPELPYLAWVPCEGQRQLMCLLCRNSRRKQGTWVSDETAHCGTHENPAGSKDRRGKGMCLPSKQVYEQNVTAARLEFHPKLEVSRAKTASESRRELYTDLPLRSEEEEEHFCQILSWLSLSTALPGSVGIETKLIVLSTMAQVRSKPGFAASSFCLSPSRDVEKLVEEQPEALEAQRDHCSSLQLTWITMSLQSSAAGLRQQVK
ncbi:Uncharacterized protein SCF082_LOCUS41636 [Durusdinium trenchii]|uniref:Uncharacterized protein n=1 Tax=Durusdinium trenchii TaxID=1381693 RepID=A0ABP0QJR8_9DINO